MRADARACAVCGRATRHFFLREPLTCKRCYGKQRYAATRITAYPARRLSGTKTRARVKGIAFALTAADLTVPSHCPVRGCGRPIVIGSGRFADNSPALDRIVPHLGYVPTNVRITCNKCNNDKCATTPDQMIDALFEMAVRGLLTDAQRTAITEINMIAVAAA